MAAGCRGREDLIRPNFSMRPQTKFGSPAFDQNGNRPGGEVALWLPSPATNRHVLLRRREHQSLSSHSRKYKSRGLLKLPCDMALLTCEVDPRVRANTAPNMRRACKSL